MKLSILAAQPSSLCYVAVLGEQELKQFALCTYRHDPERQVAISVGDSRGR